MVGPKKYSSMGILNKLPRQAGGGWVALGRSFMAIIAIKFRKKVNWGQHSIA